LAGTAGARALPPISMSASAFPAPVGAALTYSAGRVDFPVEGPTEAFSSLVPSAHVSTKKTSYSVGYYPCRPPLPLNDPRLDSCVTSNQDIWGGFGGQEYSSEKSALDALMACGPWTCEMRVKMCPRSSRRVFVEGQKVSLCGGQRFGDFPAEVSWTDGTWKIVLTPTDTQVWKQQTAALVMEERSVRLPQYPGVIDQAAGFDNDNTVLKWTVGHVDFSVWAYFGGGMSTVASFRQLAP